MFLIDQVELDGRCGGQRHAGRFYIPEHILVPIFGRIVTFVIKGLRTDREVSLSLVRGL